MRYFSRLVLLFAIIYMESTGCQSPTANNTAPAAHSATVHLLTLDPGHFHAALVQKSMQEGIDSIVHVYAPDGPELQAHLDLIKQYNERSEAPTHWSEKVYTGGDFAAKMFAEKKGNVVVLAGNNQLKTQYITSSVAAGLHVLSDKPMSISPANFTALEKAFDDAAKQKLLLYDIMTERSEITNLLQRALAQDTGIFGALAKGTENNPAVSIESVHYFYKFVSGKALVRPAWFFDPAQQGEAIADVGTHLADLVQWTCFPDTIIDYKKDISVNKARLWPTPVTKSQFTAVTKKDSFPAFLAPYVSDTILQTHGNGAIDYTLKGVHIKLTARWDYKAPEGSGDTHHCLIRGTLGNLEIRQGKEENFKPTLYIIPLKSSEQYDAAVQRGIAKINQLYPGVTAERSGAGWKLVIPEKFKVGHEAHFAQVMHRFLQYLKKGAMPEWEVPCMIAKYYTTAKALELATKTK